MADHVAKTRQEQWRDAYRANRYLAGKPEAHLCERYRYLNECITTLETSGQMGLEGKSRLGLWLLAKVTHTLLEFELRGLGLPPGMLDEAILPKTTYPLQPAGADAYAKRGRTDAGQSFKFGKRKWLEPMLRGGVFRFAPASSYADPSLNYAIRDDELHFTIYPGAHSTSGLPVGIKSQPGTDCLTITHPTDYYLQCFTTRHALRLYDDFEADCCLVIYDGKQFGQRLLPVLKARFTDWIVGAVPVSYIDPDDPGTDPVVIPRVKHLRYAYQNEERIICHPRTELRNSLSAITVEIGSLEDIAELITISA